MSIKENIFRIEQEINKVSKEALLIAVVKNRTVDEIMEAYSCGLRHFGENRIQEALPKIEKLQGFDIIWHLVGHLQSNKAKYAVRFFDLIHSIDKIETLNEVDKNSLKLNKVQDVLVQVNTSKEPTKFGIDPDDTSDFVKKTFQFKNIRVKGLMTIGPLSDDVTRIRDSFLTLLNLLKDLKPRYPELELKYLSMGMTDDYKIALEYGANMLRIGRAIFEKD